MAADDIESHSGMFSYHSRANAHAVVASSTGDKSEMSLRDEAASAVSKGLSQKLRVAYAHAVLVRASALNDDIFLIAEEEIACQRGKSRIVIRAKDQAKLASALALNCGAALKVCSRSRAKSSSDETPWRPYAFAIRCSAVMLLTTSNS